MTTKNGDLPAMPVHANGSYIYSGLTKREMMAMHMMSALITNVDDPSIKGCSLLAVEMADALLAELERTK